MSTGHSKPKSLFRPENQPMRIAVLFSGNAGSAQFVHSNKNPKLKIVCALTDRKDALGIPKLEALGIPVIKADFREFCSQNSLGPRDLEGREKYFSHVLSQLKKFNPDVLMLSGFMKIITEPLLSAFNYRILNVHPADLTILEGGKPKFTGANPVYDAVLAGEREIRASVHLVTKDVDCGPVIVLSKPVEVEGSLPPEQLAPILQERLKRKGDDPAYLKAIELIADGMAAIQNGKVFVKENQEWKQGYFDSGSGSVKP